MAEEKGTEATSQPAKGKKPKGALDPIADFDTPLRKDKKRRKTNKPVAVQAAVIAESMMGKSNSQISRDLEIHRDTVAVILSQAELGRLRNVGITRCHQMIESASDTMETAIKTGDIAASTTILKGTGVLKKAVDADPSQRERGPLEGITFSVVVINEGDAKRLSAGITARRSSHEQHPVDAEVHQNAG